LPTAARAAASSSLREQTENAEAQLVEGDLAVDDPHVAQEGRLRKLIEPRLPEVDLPELLIEVDGWAGFTDRLTPLSGNRRRSADMPAVLYAVILAQATNLGLTGMARASEFSYQQLEWAWEQLCREDTLTAASATLVDYHHRLPLAQERPARSSTRRSPTSTSTSTATTRSTSPADRTDTGCYGPQPPLLTELPRRRTASNA
jgi:hypothetical protein